MVEAGGRTLLACKAIFRINNVHKGKMNANLAFNGPISAGIRSSRPTGCNSPQLCRGRHLFCLDIGPRTFYSMNENKMISFSE